MMRDQGRLDQAIGVYQDIRARYANLTSLNLVIGAAYRRKAALESDASARRAALDRAIECYTELLKADPEDRRAKAELASTQAEASADPELMTQVLRKLRPLVAATIVSAFVLAVAGAAAGRLVVRTRIARAPGADRPHHGRQSACCDALPIYGAPGTDTPAIDLLASDSRRLRACLRAVAADTAGVCVAAVRSASAATRRA